MGNRQRIKSEFGSFKNALSQMGRTEANVEFSAQCRIELTQEIS